MARRLGPLNEQESADRTKIRMIFAAIFMVLLLAVLFVSNDIKERILAVVMILLTIVGMYFTIDMHYRKFGSLPWDGKTS